MWFFLVLSLSAYAIDLPPKVLYHVGHKDFLQENARSGTIPDAVWREKIMGEDTRFGLLPWRRGLYGGASYDDLEIYSTELLSNPGDPKTPWVMKITLKEECRRPEAVTTFGDDEKFPLWVLQNLEALQRSEFCLGSSLQNCDHLVVNINPIGVPSPGENSVPWGKHGSVCDDFVNQFMIDANPRVAKDLAWNSSWYLRDRNCIESIESSPRVVLEVLAEATWDAKTRNAKSLHFNIGLGDLAILVEALHDEPAANTLVLKKIREKMARSEVQLDPVRKRSPKYLQEIGPLLIDAYQSCGRADFLRVTKEFRESASNGSSEAAPDLLRSFSRQLKHKCR